MPFQTVHVSGLTECTQHSKRVNVIVEPDLSKNYEAAIPVHGYAVLKPGTSSMSIGIRNLISLLGTLPEDFNTKWTQHINTLTYAYICTHSNATGFSPYYLLCSRHPLLPIDIEVGVFIPKLSEAMPRRTGNP